MLTLRQRRGGGGVGWGGGGCRSSRPLDKGRGRSPKKKFLLGLKIRGGGWAPRASPLDPPLLRKIPYVPLREACMLPTMVNEERCYSPSRNPAE